MPTYDYKCNQCEHEWELFQPISAKPIHKCPECGKFKAKRVIAPGAGVIFKGPGFYQTDYRSDSYKKAAQADKKAAESATSSSSDNKSESKSSGNSSSSSKD